jgi:hypothetical protein
VTGVCADAAVTKMKSRQRGRRILLRVRMGLFSFFSLGLSVELDAMVGGNFERLASFAWG